MKTLLSRDEFREGVFKRDSSLCVICKAPAVDAHHIIERRLFDNGGYFLDNGASLCATCHVRAEQTLIAPEELWDKIGAKRILPEHLYEDYAYTKWGDIQNANGTRYKGELFHDESVQKILKSAGVLDFYSDRIKYPRTYHLPFSAGKTEDDKTLEDCSIFKDKNVVLTVKMDGENTTAYADGYIHARSIDGKNHPSRDWVKKYLSQVTFELPKGWRICGENVFAKHSIHYTKLESYFYLFSIWNEKNECLSWQETIEWAKLLDLTIVPQLYIGEFNQKIIEKISQSLDTKICEGFVVRSTDKFTYGDFRRNVAKYVRAEHVQTNQHWIKSKMVENELIK